MEGTAEPDTAKCVDIATTAALKKMLMPGIIAVAVPVVVGFGLGAEALGGTLGGALLGCVLLALTMANAGGAWDNAKKYVEKGNLGGKGSEVHAAAVVGDTVGDPFKDTSGPAMNILINVMAIVSLVIAPVLATSPNDLDPEGSNKKGDILSPFLCQLFNHQARHSDPVSCRAIYWAFALPLHR